MDKMEVKYVSKAWIPSSQVPNLLADIHEYKPPSGAFENLQRLNNMMTGEPEEIALQKNPLNEECIKKLRDLLLNNVGGGAMDLIWEPELDIVETDDKLFKKEEIEKAVFDPNSGELLSKGDFVILKECKDDHHLKIDYTVLEKDTKACDLNSENVRIFTSTIPLDDKPNKNEDAFPPDCAITQAFKWAEESRRDANKW